VASQSDRSQALRCTISVGSAYVVQGIVAAVGVTLLATLAQAGTPIEQQAGLLASGAIPWVLKFVLALLLDMRPSASLRVRAVLLTGLQLCAAGCLWGLAVAWAERDATGSSSIATLTLAWITLNFILSVQDVVVDNLALDSLRGRQSWTATAMGAGHLIGMGLLGSMVLGETLAEQGMAAGLRVTAGWVAIVAAVCGASIWLPGRPTRVGRETAEARAEPTPAASSWLAWIALVFVALMLGSNMTSAITYEFVFVYLAWDLVDYTRVLLPIGTIAGIAGALAMGPLVAKLGPVRATMIAGAAMGAIWLVFATAPALWHTPSLIASYAGFEAVLQSALFVGAHALALIFVARSALPTTAFVLVMAALNLPRVLAPLLAPTLVELGWVAVFAVCGVAQLIAVAGLWPLRRANL
jgi:PAT family beta-lactamase induction signal transducer AmpG